MFDFIRSLHEWFYAPMTYERGYSCAKQACAQADDDAIVLHIVNADRINRDAFDDGWIIACKEELRTRGWTDDKFEELCL